MNETDNFALVPGPPRALEIAESGAKRILSGMIADTLALAGKARPLRIVQVNDEPFIMEVFEIMLRNWLPDSMVLSFSSAIAALEELSQSEPDLVITDDGMAGMRGSELCQRLLDLKVTYPIIVNSAWEPTEQWVRELSDRGLNVFLLPLPFAHADLRKALESAGFEILRDSIAKNIAQPPRTHQLRIVVLDDEENIAEILRMMIEHIFQDAEVLTFADEEKALKELDRKAPDLFFTDTVMSKLDATEILKLLAARKAEFPVIVMTAGYPDEKVMLECAGPNLKTYFLRKPWTVAELRETLEAAGLVTKGANHE